jgi:HSP20 family protein
MSNQENEEFKIVQYKKRNAKNKFVRNGENDKEIQNLHKRIYSPKVDLIERESCYFIRIELPGVEKSSIKISVKDDQIVFISGKKQLDEILDTDKVIYKESKYNDFTRRVKLPSIIVPNLNNDLDFKDGILKLFFTKKQTGSQNNVLNFQDFEKGMSWADI